MVTPRPALPLSQRIIGYPLCAPQTLSELVDSSYDSVRDLEATPEEIAVATDLRRDVIHVITGHERTAVTSPEVVLELLSNRVIRPLSRKWITYALDAERKRRLTPNVNNPTEMTYARVITDTPPTPRHLVDALPLTEGGIYMVLYGGGPGILSENDNAASIASLLGGAEVADVLFWHLVANQAPTLYSLRRGQGDRGGQPIAFPDATALSTAVSPARHSVTQATVPETPHQGGSQL